MQTVWIFEISRTLSSIGLGQ